MMQVGAAGSLMAADALLRHVLFESEVSGGFACSSRPMQAFAKGWGPFVEHLMDPDFIQAVKMTLLMASIAVPINTAFGVAVSEPRHCLMAAEGQRAQCWLLFTGREGSGCVALRTALFSTRKLGSEGRWCWLLFTGQGRGAGFGLEVLLFSSKERGSEAPRWAGVLALLTRRLALPRAALLCAGRPLPGPQ